MTPVTPLGAQIRGSGRRLLLGVRAVLVLLFVVPVVVLAVCAWTDWQHVGPDAVPGVSTSTHCRYVDGDVVIACYGDFVSDDGSITLHDVQIRLEVEEGGHTGPATASRTSHQWVVLGTSGARVWILLLRQVMSVSAVWLLAYAGTIVGLIVTTVVWAGRQVARAVGGTQLQRRVP